MGCGVPAPNQPSGVSFCRGRGPAALGNLGNQQHTPRRIHLRGSAVDRCSAAVVAL